MLVSVDGIRRPFGISQGSAHGDSSSDVLDLKNTLLLVMLGVY